MAEHSILVGKSYRTPDDEVREVSGMDKGDVVYRPVTMTPGPGVRGCRPSGFRWRGSPPKSKAKFPRMPSERGATTTSPPAAECL